MKENQFLVLGWRLFHSYVKDRRWFDVWRIRPLLDSMEGENFWWLLEWVEEWSSMWIE